MVKLTLGFDEAVNVSGGTPTLTLERRRQRGLYDAAATALLGDSSRLVFDHMVSSADPRHLAGGHRL